MKVAAAKIEAVRIDAENKAQAEADARLIALIKEHGKWIEPDPAQT